MTTIFDSRPVHVLLGLSILTWVLWCCGGKQTTYIGQPVAEERRIVLLEGGPHDSWWGSQPVAVEYQYSRQASSLKLSGVAELNRGGVVDTFFLTVHLIDSAGNINASHSLVSAGGRKQQEQFSFDTELPLKPDTRSMIFSFYGATRGIGGSSGAVDEFWKAP